MAEIQEIANELLRLTEANKLQWRQGTGGEEYQVFAAELLATIFRHGSPEGYRLELTNDIGRLVDGIDWSPDDPESEANPNLAELFRLAEAYVLKGSLDRTLQYLKQA